MGIQELRVLAGKLVKCYGGDASVGRYLDRDENSSIDILTTSNGKYDGAVSVSTLGLSQYSIGRYVGDKELRVEVAGIAYEKYSYIPNIISTCALNVINNGFNIGHSEVYMNVVEEYYKDLDMKHILFTGIYLWGDLTNVEFGDSVVTWLMAIPISDDELGYMDKNGFDSLESLLDASNIDVLDLGRNSVI